MASINGLRFVRKTVRKNNSSDSKITREQVKAARELLGINAAQLAELAGLSELSVRRWETGKSVRGETFEKIAQALRNQGVEFINRGDVIGVKLVKKGD